MFIHFHDYLCKLFSSCLTLVNPFVKKTYYTKYISPIQPLLNFLKLSMMAFIVKRDFNEVPGNNGEIEREAAITQEQSTLFTNKVHLKNRPDRTRQRESIPITRQKLKTAKTSGEQRGGEVVWLEIVKTISIRFSRRGIISELVKAIESSISSDELMKKLNSRYPLLVDTCYTLNWVILSLQFSSIFYRFLDLNFSD